MVHLKPEGIKQVAWHEYLIRFVLGGLVTAIAGIVAKTAGPSFGGLFLAFPAILACSTSLVEKHERKRKQQKGLIGLRRGTLAAGADAAGAAIGSVGLMAFAVCLWKLLPAHATGLALAVALLAWAAVSAVLWWTWKRAHHHGNHGARRDHLPPRT